MVCDAGAAVTTFVQGLMTGAAVTVVGAAVLQTHGSLKVK